MFRNLQRNPINFHYIKLLEIRNIVYSMRADYATRASFNLIRLVLPVCIASLLLCELCDLALQVSKSQFDVFFFTFIQYTVRIIVLLLLYIHAVYFCFCSLYGFFFGFFHVVSVLCTFYVRLLWSSEKIKINNF